MITCTVLCMSLWLSKTFSHKLYLSQHICTKFKVHLLGLICSNYPVPQGTVTVSLLWVHSILNNSKRYFYMITLLTSSSFFVCFYHNFRYSYEWDLCTKLYGFFFTNPDKHLCNNNDPGKSILSRGVFLVLIAIHNNSLLINSEV